ncbi:Guanine nucleotide-binding protein subunit beta-like protein [Acipenser ruthenus]|uniref:Guanine nucleotide-binding protein subunit beta-like protein n=1 Tax=Acipenser ruthenus TaxID=7906 RepID=A0A662YLX3_ACIRT|nr:Guanine nucleotide-binding protein subunit beta-like protein [Acipenser ruthenus]
MSMQKQLSVRDDCRPITALGYHPARREALTGCADGVIKWWDIESGRRTASSTKEHSGMITHFLYWADSKLLLSASNDGTVVVWTIGATVLEKILRFELLLDRAGGSRDSTTTEEERVSDSVTNRVSGFICKKVLAGHFHTVSGLAVVGKGSIYSTVYLISGGWDRRLCIWDLETGELQDTFCNPDLSGWHELKEVACDGVILDLAYSPKRNEFAYSSSDGLIYIRQFSPVGREMRLVSVLQGHQADITAIVWHHLSDKWISGSEDGTIRIWVGTGHPQTPYPLLQTAHNRGKLK